MFMDSGWVRLGSVWAGFGWVAWRGVRVCVCCLGIKRFQTFSFCSRLTFVIMSCESFG